MGWTFPSGARELTSLGSDIQRDYMECQFSYKKKSNINVDDALLATVTISHPFELI